jgi:hypothetical protein
MTPTARTLATLRAEGWTAAVVEKWIPQTHQRKDLFGVIDILAIRDDMPVLGVQCTTASNAAARIAKAIAEPAMRTWLRPALFEVWGWAKRGARGKRKLWTVVRTPLVLWGGVPIEGGSPVERTMRKNP